MKATSILLFCFYFLLSNHSLAQNTADVLPVYPGGEEAMNKYLRDSLRFPEKPLQNRITGTAWVTFIVDTLGKPKDIQVSKGFTEYPEMDAEAIRLIKHMPAWAPGTKRGKKVEVPFKIPVRFIIK